VTNLRGCLFRFILASLLGLAAVAGALAYLCFSPYRNPARPSVEVARSGAATRSFSSGAFLEVERGTSTAALAKALEEQGVVRSQYLFLLVRALQPRARLQAGDYLFDRPLSPVEVFDKIRRGEVFFEELRVPEGSNMFDIAALLGNLNSVKPENFLKAASDPRMILDLDPNAPDLEGYLFPSTYHVTRQTTAAQLCRLMTEQFRKTWAASGGEQRKADIHKIVTLASLVEKESAIPAERPQVAAVFENRLKIDMPLQCDPTTVYAAQRENRYNGVIHKSDLASANPYNTYAHPGLPPGPIANPGAESLKAALHPADVDYLYFVAKADGSGSHQFSSALADHARAVEAYRKRSSK
jgi:UPF0755 protein